MTSSNERSTASHRSPLSRPRLYVAELAGSPVAGRMYTEIAAARAGFAADEDFIRFVVGIWQCGHYRSQGALTVRESTQAEIQCWRQERQKLAAGKGNPMSDVLNPLLFLQAEEWRYG